MAQLVKNPPAMQEIRVQCLGREDSLEKGMSTHSSILAWRIPWTEESGGLQSTGLQFVSPSFTSPHHVLQSICLLRNFSNISRKVSGLAVGSVGSAPTQIWPHSSLYLLPKPTIAPRVHSLANYGYLVSCTGGCRGEFLSLRLRSPWRSALVWRLPLFVGLPPAPVPHPDQSRQ